MSDDLREVPAQIHRPDGGTTEARIVMPQWTPDELVSIVRTQAEWGNITREQADREIAHIREGAARQQAQRKPEPRKVSEKQLADAQDRARDGWNKAAAKLAPASPPSLSQPPRERRSRRSR